MFKNIDLCIPYVSSGINALEYFINNLIITTTKFSRLKIIVSYHNNNELRILESSSIFKHIYKTVHAKVFENNDILFRGSYNHSIAINYLIKNTENEIIIISDFDMAFLKYGWDEIIEHNLNNNCQIIGTCYPAYTFTTNKVASSNKIIEFPNPVTLTKYQNLPNLSFFCSKKKIIKNFFNNRLTNFDEFLLEGSLPFRFVNTKKLSNENNLPLGSFQWLDTGYEIPEIIHKNQISYKTLLLDYDQKLFIIDHHIHAVDRPEVYLFPGSNFPFLVHFKKFSKKLKKNHNIMIKNFDIVSNFLKI
jgi:hypothetical protein